MNSPTDFEHARVLIFGGFEGARYRAGRTQRLLTRRFKHVIDASVLNAAEFAAAVESINAPLWLVRAGAMPRGLSHWFLPPPNGKPLCAFGVTWRSSSPSTPRANALLREALKYESAQLERESAAWHVLQAQTGGNFSELSNFHEQCPPIASALLDARLVADFASKLSAGCTVNRALREILSATSARCARLPHLDVFDDPALRVAQVVTSLQRGGAERIALDLTRELSRWRVRPLLFVLGAPTRAAFDPPDELVQIPPGKNRAEHVRNFAAAAVAMGCDAVHAHLLSADDMALVAVSGLPLMATVHNVRQGWPAGFTLAAASKPPSQKREALLERSVSEYFARPTLPGVTLLAACAQAVERDLIDARFGIPVRIVWNGIDAGEFQMSPENAARTQTLRERLEFSPNDFVLLALANPRQQKRLERLPAVLAVLREMLKQRRIAREAKLIVAGEASRGSDDATRCAAALRAEIERLALNDHVRLIGAADQVAPLLLACDALVSVSAWEGLSLAHLEALAAGRPVVATDAGGTAEIARDFPELSLVLLDAPAEFVATKLAELAALDRRLPAGQSAAEPAGCKPTLQSFALHTMAARYASLYPRVIENARRFANGLDGSETRPTGIWLIANNFTTGGAQSSARRLLLGMNARGIRVRAAVLQEREDNPTPGLRALRDGGVPVFIPEPRAADPLDAVQQILERMDADPPRAILFWNAIAEHKILLADALWSIPIFDVSPGEMFFDSFEAYFARPRPGLPYRCAAEYGARLAGVVVKYRAEAPRAERFLSTATHVIPNGLPLDEWALSARASDGRIVIGTSTRISPQKKLEKLLDALRIATPNLPPHVLRIAGRAETGAEDYAARLRNSSADMCVEWIGEFQSSQQFLAELDIFAMISEPAGCPNASLEAMAAGLPIVATDHGGASEQIEDGVTGRLIPRADARAFAAALVELAHNEAMRREFGAAARARVEQRFSIERMVDDYARLCLGA